jgi:hypothetical protein
MVIFGKMFQDRKLIFQDLILVLLYNIQNEMEVRKTKLFYVYNMGKRTVDIVECPNILSHKAKKNRDVLTPVEIYTNNLF